MNRPCPPRWIPLPVTTALLLGCSSDVSPYADGAVNGAAGGTRAQAEHSGGSGAAASPLAPATSGSGGATGETSGAGGATSLPPRCEAFRRFSASSTTSSGTPECTTFTGFRRLLGAENFGPGARLLKVRGTSVIGEVVTSSGTEPFIAGAFESVGAAVPFPRYGLPHGFEGYSIMDAAEHVVLACRADHCSLLSLELNDAGALALASTQPALPPGPWTETLIEPNLRRTCVQRHGSAACLADGTWQDVPYPITQPHEFCCPLAPAEIEAVNDGLAWTKNGQLISDAYLYEDVNVCCTRPMPPGDVISVSRWVGGWVPNDMVLTTDGLYGTTDSATIE